MERRRKHKSDRASQNACCRINIYNSQTDLPIKISSVRKLVQFFLQKKGVVCQELSVYFVSKKKISKLHADHFQDPSPTDCITFPLDQDFLGEIFVCPQAALAYNPKHPYEETTLYLLHALLHLLGYDDITSKERARMRREEKKLMTLAKKACYIIRGNCKTIRPIDVRTILPRFGI
jgi:probable rRNA maturation factor